MEVGIIGLPNSGKSTLFNAITSAGAEVGAYPFTTTSQNVGVGQAPDRRLHEVAETVGSKRIVPAAVRFVDIAGLVKGASQGEGLGNQFLGFIRNVDAIAHVVRAFENPNVAHVHGEVNPIEDIEVINAELMLADLAIVEKLQGKEQKQAKSGDKKVIHEVEVLRRAREALGAGRTVGSLGLVSEDAEFLRDTGLLTDKPMAYVVNVGEDDLGKETPEVEEVRRYAEGAGVPAVVISAKIESELAELSEDERTEFMEGLGIEHSGLSDLIQVSHQLLGLITFFTIESDECRAWTVPAGTHAPQAAGKIHTDMERGFIKAEVVSWEDLVEAGSFHAARTAGHLLVEGREYIVRDGDVILFKFSV